MYTRAILKKLEDSLLLGAALAFLMGALTMWLFFLPQLPSSDLVSVGETANAQKARRMSVHEYSWSALKAGAPVFIGDTLQTRSQGKLSIAFENGKHLEISEDSMVQIEEEGKQVRVTILDGKATGEGIEIIHESPFTISKPVTPRGSILAFPTILPVPAKGPYE
jgi:hypothetical protein